MLSPADAEDELVALECFLLRLFSTEFFDVRVICNTSGVNKFSSEFSKWLAHSRIGVNEGILLVVGLIKKIVKFIRFK